MLTRGHFYLASFLTVSLFNIRFDFLTYPDVGLCKKAISEFPFASVSKRVFVQNLSHENEAVGGTHFHMNGFILTQRQKASRKWPID